MTAFATVDYDERVHRIAFPQRSPLTETLVDTEDRSALAALLASTNVIEAHRAGDRRIVAPEDDYVGDHRDYVLAPFAYRSASRFSDGSFGVLYAAESRDTALREVLSRLARTYLDGSAPAQETRKQHLILRVVAGDLVDICRARVPDVDVALYDTASYAAAQAFGSAIREHHPGLTYDSVRHRGGVCVGAFVPRIVSDVRLQSALSVVWDGQRFTEQKDIRPL
jgi:RES domain-containing protein